MRSSGRSDTSQHSLHGVKYFVVSGVGSVMPTRVSVDVAACLKGVLLTATQLRRRCDLENGDGVVL